MKRISLLALLTLFLLSSTAFALQLKSENYSVSVPDQNDITSITHNVEYFLTIDYKNKDEISYRYLNRDEASSKYYFIPSSIDEHSDNFLSDWETNVKSATVYNGILVFSETLPDKNGIIFIRRFNNGRLFAEGMYIVDSKVYVVSINSETADFDSIKISIHKLINTIYPR